MAQRQGFSSKIGLLLATIGASVGLGNIWKFPYIMGKNGGAAFLIAYLLLAAAIGIPLLMFETAVGRRGGKNAIDSVNSQSNHKVFNLTGYIGVSSSTIVSFIYFVIAGWIVFYFGASLFNQIPSDTGKFFTDFITDPVWPLVTTAIFALIILGLLILGVKNGIEKFNVIFMPVLLIMLIIIIIRSVTLPNASEGLSYIFKPDWSKLANISTWQAALVQLFYSVNIGFAIMITYGSYIPKDENLVAFSLKVVIADTMVGVLAAIAIFPAVFSFGLEPATGPSLMFITLPKVFQAMAGGQFFAIIFFFSVIIAALSSAIALAEVVVLTVHEKLGIARKKASIIVTSVIIAFGLLASLSYSTSLGKYLTIGNFPLFDIFDITVEKFSLLLGGLLLTLLVGFGMKKADITEEITDVTKDAGTNYVNISYIITKFIAPCLILLLLITNIQHQFFK